MKRYQYNAGVEKIDEWLTAAKKLRKLIDEGTRGAVDIQSADWYARKKAQCHLIGTPAEPVAVYAVTEELELVTLIKSPKSIVLGGWLVCDAVVHGAAWLMCLDTEKLNDLYTKAGFRRVADMPWDESLAPEGWDYARHGRPYLSFYVHINYLSKSALDTYQGGRFMSPSYEDAEARVKRLIE